MKTRNNNKKRNNIDDIESNKSEKKLKKDETENKYNNIKWNEINVNELDGLLYKDLKVIGKSIGIPLNSISRLKLIDGIKFIIKFNNESIEKKNIPESNPFNKSTFNQLIITSDKQGQDELLFWKIFKNKTIFKKVMSFMNVLPNSIPYDYIISVKEMVDNNQISILKDKVKRNKYLSFKDPYDSNAKPEDSMLIKLFSTIQDDKSFYQSLFTNYMDELMLFDSSLEYVTKKLISTNCLIGYQILISIHNYKSTNYDLQCAIQFSRWEFSKFIFNQIPPNDKFGNYFPGFNNGIKLSKNIKSINEFLNSYKQYSKLNLIDVLDKDNIFKYGWFKFKNVNPLNTRLKDLIKWVELYELLDPKYQVFKKSKFEYPEYYKGTIQDKLMSTPIQTIFNEIKSFKFSVKQLKSNVTDPINYSSNEKSNIIKLLHVIFKVIFQDRYNTRRLADYYLCYNDEDIADDATTVNSYRLDDGNVFLEAALKYGNYSKFNKCFNDRRFINQGGQSSIYEFHILGSTDDSLPQIFDCFDQNRILSNEPINILFSNCKDKETQINFINSAIQDIKTNDPKQYKLKPMFLFALLVNFDDLELVKLFVNKLGKQHIRITVNVRDGHSCFINSITRYIKSIDMLDYIFNEFYNLIIQNRLYDNDEVSGFIRCQFINLNLLKHFQSLNNNIGGTQQIKLLWVDIPNLTVDIIEHVLTNSNHYCKLKELISDKPIDFNDNQDRYFSILKHSIETSTDIQFNPLSFFIQLTINLKTGLSILHYYPPKSFIKYLIWLNEYPSFKFEIPYKELFLRLIQYFITNQQDYQQLLKEVTFDEIIENFSHITRYSIIRGDLITLSTILDCLLNSFDILVSKLSTDTKAEKRINLSRQDKIKYFILYNIINIAVIEDQFLVLEYLYFNYNRILKKKPSKPIKFNNVIVTSNQDPIFTLAELSNFPRPESNSKISKLMLSIAK